MKKCELEVMPCHYVSQNIIDLHVSYVLEGINYEKVKCRTDDN